MIGRGALRDPFLFREIAKLEKRKILSEDWTYWDLISRHLKLLQTSYTDFYVGVQFRKFLTWYSAGIEGASQLRKALYDPANQETQKVLELAEAFFHPKDGRVVEKQRSFLNEPFLQGGHG
jgi:tRNA-dihydrouridine synthase